MWPFSKPKKLDHQAEARKVIEELRAEFSDEDLARGMVLNDRVSRLQSVKVEQLNELLGLVDDTADRVLPLYDDFPNASGLEIHGFCASTVAAAVHVSTLPTDEKPIIIDIFLDLWVDATVRQAPSLDGKILKGSISRMWRGYLPVIMRAAADEEAVKLGFPNPPLVLAQELDRLVSVERGPVDQIAAGQVLKSAVVDAMLFVRNF